MQSSSSAASQIVEHQLKQVTQALENEIDRELDQLDRLDSRDLEQLRKKRIEEMKQQGKNRETWIANGHGTYTELASEKDFFEQCKSSENVAVHFYRDSAFRCTIVDKHMQLLAPKHLECKFVKLNAEKSPFLTQRLQIRVIPSILLLKDQKTVDCIIGFDDLGGHDEFTTEMLEWRIAQSGAIQYKGDLRTPPDQQSGKGGKSLTNIMGYKKSKKTIREKDDDANSSDDNDW